MNQQTNPCFSKEEIQIIIQIIESVNLPVKQTEEIIIPLLQKLRAMLMEKQEE
jgi:hypothetical protein